MPVQRSRGNGRFHPAFVRAGRTRNMLLACLTVTGDILGPNDSSVTSRSLLPPPRPNHHEWSACSILILSVLLRDESMEFFQELTSLPFSRYLDRSPGTSNAKVSPSLDEEEEEDNRILSARDAWAENVEGIWNEILQADSLATKPRIVLPGFPIEVGVSLPLRWQNNPLRPPYRNPKER